MTRYIIRRLLQSIPLLILVSLFVFAMLHAVPGGPMGVYGKNPNMTAEDIKRLEHALGLDQPVHVQYWGWLQKAATGDFGYSFDTRRPATVEIGDRIPATLYLMGVTFLLTLLVAIPIGVISAFKQYSWIDLLITTLAYVGQALPIFWIGLVLIMLASLVPSPVAPGQPLLPTGGMFTIGKPFDPWDWLSHLVLPVFALSLAWVSWYSRYIRAPLLEVLHSDYIRTAYAKELKDRMVVYRHALNNAAIPLVTIVAMDLPTLFGGSLYTEIIFSWPGMGRLFFTAAGRRDYPILMAVIIITSALMIIANLLADIVYAWLDPRVKYE